MGCLNMSEYTVDKLTDGSSHDWALVDNSKWDNSTPPLTIPFDFATPCKTPNGYTNLALYSSSGHNCGTVSVNKLDIEKSRLKNILLTEDQFNKISEDCF